MSSSERAAAFRLKFNTSFISPNLLELTRFFLPVGFERFQAVSVSELSVFLDLTRGKNLLE